MLTQRGNPDASIIIAAYEQAVTLPLVLRCLLAMPTRRQFEIIVCDDGSSAEMFSACSDLIQTAPVPIYWVWQQDRGFTAAASTNNGISLARGRYVLFTDADMIPALDLLDRHLEAHASGKRLVVGDRLWRNLPQVESGLPMTPSEILRLLQGTDAVTAGSKAAEWLEKKIQARRFASPEPWHGCFSCNLSVERTPAVYEDENFHGWGFEDTEMAYRLAAVEGLEVYHEPGAIAYHLANLDSNPWLTRKHEDIVNYLRNLCYFLDKWPGAFGDYPMDLLPFALDAETNTWSAVRSQKTSFGDFVEKARQWLKENGQYPQQASGG